MKRWIPAVLLILLVCPASALAQTKVGIQVDAGDKPLQIKGWLGSENAFTGNMRLTASGGNLAAFTFLPSDLKRKEGDEVIGRQQVELVGKPPLSAEVPKDFQVKVNGIKVPGTYEGQVELLLPGQKRSEAMVIPLTVMAKAKPALVPVKGGEQVRRQLVRCSWGLDCALAQLLLPASAFQNQWELKLDNPVEAPVSLTSTEVVLEGQQTGYQITKAEVESPPSPATLAANQIINLPLKWKRSQIPPDRYTGWVYLTLDGREERLAIPVDLNMRIGPLLPLLVLLVGIALGRLFKYMQEKGIPQSDALGKVNELEQQIAEADPEDQKILTPMVKQVRKSVYQMDLETVTAKVEVIADRLDCLKKLRSLEHQLAGKEQNSTVAEVLQQINAARNQILQSKDEQAKKLLVEIEEKIAKLIKSSMMGPQKPDASLTEAAKQAEEAKAAAERAEQVRSRSSIALSGWVVQLKRSLIFLSGVSTAVRAEATLWVVRPLLSLALLFGLSVVGIRALYVEKGATFGADPFADYLGLVLWGLSADVASRSLSNLPGGEAKNE